MPPQPLNKDSKIVIVGAGVFGLSTALHLVQRGYRNIHLFDKQPFDKNQYSEEQGADGASCDLNKIVRASYGGRHLYQDLAFKAMPEWQRWNRELAQEQQDDDVQLPDCLKGDDVKLWHNCGFVRLSGNEGGGGGLEPSEIETQKNFPERIKYTQYRVSDAKWREDALRDGLPPTKIDPFDRLGRGLPVDGILDMTAGFVLASRACAWALHLCVKSGGVKTYLGEEFGLRSFLKTGDTVTGIITAGMERHSADLVLVACGGWTPSLLPDVDRLLETTGGSVLSIQLPKHRQDLWDKYAEEKFPVWSWNTGSYKPHATVGGIYGLPRTPEGIVKIAFRGAKWTSYTRRSSVGEKVSYPQTDMDKIPAEAMRVLQTFCAENLPDLLELDLSKCRLCWYTDSVDNDFLIDHVAGTRGLVVASGGSGHGFKFLPVLGEHVVDVLEGKDTEYTRLFRWRRVPEGERNGLEEGPEGWRTLDRQRLAGNREWRGLESSRL
ncbi:L-saccharopine oxidase [Lecanosticta acicola]|uniref:L-saccharopine oxidase n=1 Tax=Lecanosticta acicola TaxID=111012 RepID=A0AAI8Z503_9PEZI|nr:L-saccharopine oxidase [Lecanosticta acicola]